MKRNAEKHLLEAEGKLLRISPSVHNTTNTESEEASDTTTTSGVSSTSSVPAAAQQPQPQPVTPQVFLTSKQLEAFFYKTLYDNIGPHILTKSISENASKTRFVLDTTYSAFFVLLNVELANQDTDPIAVCALLVWIAEVAMARFFNAPVINEVHDGHIRSFWGVVRAVAFASNHETGSHSLQRASRALIRRYENNDSNFDVREVETNAFEKSKDIASQSVSLPFVLNPCRDAAAIFTPPQSPPQIRGGRRR